MYWIRRKYKQVKRVISYLPVIWRGYDWDYMYALDVFKHQLGRLADDMEHENANGLTAHERAKSIRTTIKLMDKVYNEDYACEYQDQIKKLYGKTSFDYIESESEINGSKLYTMKLTNERAVDEDHQKEIDEVKHQMYLLSKDKQEKAHRILWQYIEHNIQRWWD